MPPTTTRPLPPDALARLRSVAEVCDVLRCWGESDLADRIVYFASEDDLDNGDVSVTLESARGFLAFFGAVESEGEVRLTCTPEGWICAEWDFPDNRDAGLWFLDADRVTFSAIGRDGKFIDIRSGKKIAPCRVILKQLASDDLFVCR